jgi:hypothetical protein
MSLFIPEPGRSLSSTLLQLDENCFAVRKAVRVQSTQELLLIVDSLMIRSAIAAVGSRPIDWPALIFQFRALTLRLWGSDINAFNHLMDKKVSVLGAQMPVPQALAYYQTKILHDSHLIDKFVKDYLGRVRSAHGRILWSYWALPVNTRPSSYSQPLQVSFTVDEYYVLSEGEDSETPAPNA